MCFLFVEVGCDPDAGTQEAIPGPGHSGIEKLRRGRKARGLKKRQYFMGPEDKLIWGSWGREVSIQNDRIEWIWIPSNKYATRLQNTPNFSQCVFEIR